MTIKGIDISHWNRVLSFDKVKEYGIEFCIIKACGSDKGFYEDIQFDNYYRLATLAGLGVGAYYFAGPKFYGEAAGRADAQRFIRILNGRKFDYPLYIDIETTSTSSKAQRDATLAAVTFCRTMEEFGYYAGIYASDISGFKERLDIDILEPFDKWVARYGKKPEYVKEYGMWQKSSTGTIPGIVGNVDLDIAYKDYPAIMKKHHLNNWR